jgi:hypothetical protein
LTGTNQQLKHNPSFDNYLNPSLEESFIENENFTNQIPPTKKYHLNGKKGQLIKPMKEQYA